VMSRTLSAEPGVCEFCCYGRGRRHERAGVHGLEGAPPMSLMWSCFDEFNRIDVDEEQTASRKVISIVQGDIRQSSQKT
jgi:hypothetical protein